jgi:hypothetical protein
VRSDGGETERGGIDVEQSAIAAIQAMLAPVVLMTVAAIIAAGIQAMYSGVNDRMRDMAAERFSRLATAHGELTRVADLPAAIRERVAEIDTQLPALRRRHRMLRNALLCIYMAVLIVVVAMVLIAISVAVPSPPVGDVALVVVLVATGSLLAGLTLVAAAVRHSADTVDYEIEAVLGLGS